MKGNTNKSDDRAKKIAGAKKIADSKKKSGEELEKIAQALKVAHQNALMWAWKEHGDAIFVSAMMHSLHTAMMQYEVEFLDSVSQKNRDKSGDSGKSKKDKPNGKK